MSPLTPTEYTEQLKIVAERFQTHSPPEVLKSLDKTDLEGPWGEIVLALALSSYRSENDCRKQAKALIKRSKQGRLIQALKRFPRRKYEYSSDGKKDLEAVAQDPQDLDIVMFSFGLYTLGHTCLRKDFVAHLSSEAAHSMLVDILSVGNGRDKDGNSFKIPCFTMEGAWPSKPLFELLPSVLKDIPNLLPNTRQDFLVLEVEVLDGDTPLCPIPNPLRLRVCGPCKDISVIQGTTNLQSLQLRDTQITDLRGLSLPDLLFLRYDNGPLEHLFEAPDTPKLLEIDIESAPNLKSFDSILSCPQIRKIAVSRSAVAVISPEIAQTQSLKVLNLINLPLTTLPQELERLSLEELRLFDIDFKTLPVIQQSPPSYISLQGSTYPEDVAGPTHHYLGLPCTWSLFTHIIGPPLTTQYKDSKLIAETIARYRETQDAEATKIRALMLAALYVYYDDEHGRSSYTFWFRQVQKHGGPIEKQAQSVLNKAFLSDAKKQLPKWGKKLQSVQGFDSEAFVQFGLEMASYWGDWRWNNPA